MDILYKNDYNGKLGDIINGKVKNLPGMTKDGNMNTKSRKILTRCYPKDAPKWYITYEFTY